MKKLLLLAISILLLCTSALAQRATLPWPKVAFYDSNGRPLAGGRLWSYVAGTTTPLATYPDYAGIAANTNPVILDAAGRADVWLLGRAYKFILEDSTCQYRDVYGSCHGNLIWTVDNIVDWGLMDVDLTTAVAGILPTANGGTGVAYFAVAGPSEERTYTFPDADSTIPSILTGTGALDFGSTGAQSSSDLTITVTGAVVGNVVMLGTPVESIEDDTCYTAWVSDDDEVTVRFNNYSSGAVDPDSGTFRATVIP